MPLDIWIRPNTPNCNIVQQIVGDNTAVRLIDADVYRDYVPRELKKVPGFVYTVDGKTYPWQGEQCVTYVRLWFGGQNLGAPQDVRSAGYAYAQQPQHQQQPQYQQPQYQQQPQFQQQPIPPQRPGYPAPANYQQQPVHQRPPPQQPAMPPSLAPVAGNTPQAGGFGMHMFSDLMANRVSGSGASAVVNSFDPGSVPAGQQPVSTHSLEAERARQNAMYLQRT